MLNHWEQGICTVLKCFPKDCILVAKEEKKKNVNGVNKTKS